MTANIVPSNNNQLAAVPAPRAAQPENPLLLAHRYLRGRYPLAIALALVLAIPGAIVGYMAVPPMYSSSGIIHIAPTLPRLMYSHDENEVPPMFDTFVATQSTILSSRRVLDMAAASEELRRAGLPGGPEGVSELGRALNVSNRRGTAHITATVEHQNPRLAQTAINAILEAYEVVHQESRGLTASQREQQLRARQRELQAGIERLRTQISDLGRPFGTEDLDQLHRDKGVEIARLDRMIADLEVQLPLATAEANLEEGAEADPTPELELEQFARRDRRLGNLVDRRMALVLEIEAAGRLLGPEHRTMRDLRRRKDSLDEQIDERLAFLRENDVLPLPKVDLAGEPQELSRSEIQNLIAQHRQVRDRLNEEALRIGRTRMSIIALQEQLTDRRRSLAETSRILEQIEVERENLELGRVSILQRGDLPTRPSKDRRIPLALFGAMAGIGVGAGFAALGRILRSDFRYIDEVERVEQSAPLLGTVPDLSDADGDASSLAALSIHHVRNMLELNTPPADSGSTVYAISSAQAGDGKTSVALSLAMSFAATGNRTLLIDADLVGRGLSRQLALTRQPGLREALKATTLNGELHETRIANLWALPVGGDERLEAEQMARADVRRVLDLAREQFDTIVLDTGPILGSLEANIVAPLSDRVVLVVSRGQSAKLLRSAIDRLGRLGAVCGGLIFNRAEGRDFERSTSAVSVSGRSLREQGATRDASPASAPLALIEAVESTSSETPQSP